VGIVVDTSILVAAERERFDLDRLLSDFADGELFVATATIGELRHGLERTHSDAARERRRAFLDFVRENFGLLPFGVEDAEVMGRIGARLAEVGLPIGSIDLIIAATAIAGDHVVATLNSREFSRVQEVRLLPVDSYRVPSTEAQG
jgi:tRNA(fMet)-specific endonuclease VapC